MNAKIVLFAALVALFALHQTEAVLVVPAYTSVISPYYGAYYGWPRVGYTWGYPGYAAWWGANKNKESGAAPTSSIDGPAPSASGLTGNQ